MRIHIWLFGSILVLAAPWVQADRPALESEPTLGLVLAGGGARGAAHVGVLKVLEELEIRPDVIAGTSMGAIIGGLYAAGLDAQRLERVLDEMDWERVFTDDPGRPERSMRRKQLDRDFVIPRRLGFDRTGLQVPLGALQGQHLDQALKRILGDAVTVRNFDDLAIPFRAVATDIATGEAVVIGSGSLVQALRASMSVPALFAPVSLGGQLLVDGGVAMNLPVEVAQELGADVLIVVDISTPLHERDELDSVLKITDQLTNFLTLRNTRESLDKMGPDDVLIVPELGNITVTQFPRAMEAIALGEAAAREALGELRQIAAARRSAPPPEFTPSEGVIVDFIELNNTSRLDDEILLSRISFQPGDPLDLDRLESELSDIYALDVFDAVRYDIIRDDELGTGLIIHAQERSWGPNYMQFGLTLISDFSAIQDFSIGAVYTRNAINRLGADLRVSGSIGRFSGIEVDLYQPLDRRALWFVQPVAQWSLERRDIYADTTNLGTLEIESRSLRLGAGRNIGQRMQLRTDLEWGREQIRDIRGGPLGLDGRNRIGEITLAGRYDSLNNIHFPTRGSQIELVARRSDTALDASENFFQYQFTGVTAFTRGRWSLLTRSLLGLSSDDHVPLSSLYRLGGFGQISGLPPDALLGPQAGLIAVSGQRRIADLRLLPIYAGATLEAGNVWDRRSQMSFSDLRYAASTYFGIDSFLGPLYLAFGMDEDGNSSFYFYLGNPFELRRR